LHPIEQYLALGFTEGLFFPFYFLLALYYHYYHMFESLKSILQYFGCFVGVIDGKTKTQTQSGQQKKAHSLENST